ncbi:hypothetical protein JHW43_006931 [Diplocarpon mali]|nr:hypothetical protein JHW43_006931 [Diplocarpon mali]
MASPAPATAVSNSKPSKRYVPDPSLRSRNPISADLQSNSASKTLVRGDRSCPERDWEACDSGAATACRALLCLSCAYHKEYKLDRQTAIQIRRPACELWTMIEEMIFTLSSGKKPRLLWAVQGNRELYIEAKKLWCKINGSGFTYQESKLPFTGGDG